MQKYSKKLENGISKDFFKRILVIFIFFQFILLNSCDETTISFIPIYEPIILQPSSGDTIIGTSINFISDIHHEKYQMQISVDSNFTNILFNETIFLEMSRDTSIFKLSTGIFKNGLYYFRLRNFWNSDNYNLRKSVWVKSYFIINKQFKSK